MKPGEITVGTLVALKSRALGVVTHIASDDDPTVPASAPVRVQRKDEDPMIQVVYEEIADAGPHGF